MEAAPIFNVAADFELAFMDVDEISCLLRRPALWLEDTGKTSFLFRRVLWLEDADKPAGVGLLDDVLLDFFFLVFLGSETAFGSSADGGSFGFLDLRGGLLGSCLDFFLLLVDPTDLEDFVDLVRLGDFLTSSPPSRGRSDPSVMRTDFLPGDSGVPLSLFFLSFFFFLCLPDLCEDALLFMVASRPAVIFPEPFIESIIWLSSFSMSSWL